MGDARDRLLARIVDHVAANGLADASLRELADEVGTSHRMLNYHFGGRDGLVAAIVQATEAGQREALVELGRDASTPEEVIEAQWEQLAVNAMGDGSKSTPAIVDGKLYVRTYSALYCFKEGS